MKVYPKETSMKLLYKVLGGTLTSKLYIVGTEYITKQNKINVMFEVFLNTVASE